MTEEELDALEGIAWLNAVVYRDSVGSTNDLALRQELVEGDGWGWLFVADEQTAGRGRRGNAWWAGEGALTFSLVVDTSKLGLVPDRLPLLPLAVGLAVRDVVATELPAAGVTVKWPNDVYLNARKVAGILVEQRADRNDLLVLGVGVNVNVASATVPAELADSAISLATVSGERHDLVALLGGVLLRLETRLGQVVTEPLRLVADLNAYSFLTGRRVRLDCDATQTWGDCRGIADNGGLQLATANGLQTFVGGTVGAID